MNATITYLLTEQAQRTQMAATGQPVARTQTTTIEVTADDLPYLIADENGNLSQRLNLGVLVNGKPTPDIETLDGATAWAQYRAYWQERHAVEAARRAEDQAERRKNGAYNREQAEIGYRAFLADPSARLSDHSNQRPIDQRTPADWWAYEHAEWIAEIRRRNASDAAAREVAAAATEQSKLAAISAYVAASGDALLIQQHTDGLLGRKTILYRMADSALDAAGLPVECPDSVVCRNSDCPCYDSAADVVPPEVYARWKAIGPLPDGASVEFREVRNCLRDESDPDQSTFDDTAGPVEYHAIVTIPSGPFQFKRRIKLA